MELVGGGGTELVFFVQKSMTSVDAVIDFRQELLQYGPPAWVICNLLTVWF